MKKYFAQLKENEEKGFSLVELIIVIAIMAILVGVVASQVIPYMEKSRQSKDQQLLSEVATAMVSAVAQSPTEVGAISGKALSSITDNEGGTGTNISTNLTELLNKSSLTAAQTDIVGKFKSKEFKKYSQINIEYDNTTGKTYVYVGSKNTAKKTTVESD